MEAKVPVHADHSLIVKFKTQNDRAYRSVLNKLREFKRDAPSVVSARFLRAQNIPKPSLMVPIQRESAFVGRAQELLRTREPDKVGAMEETVVDLAGRDIGKQEQLKQINHFQGTNNTNGGKGFYGTMFNSGGGPMSF